MHANRTATQDPPATPRDLGPIQRLPRAGLRPCRSASPGWHGAGSNELAHGHARKASDLRRSRRLMGSPYEGKPQGKSPRRANAPDMSGRTPRLLPPTTSPLRRRAHDARITQQHPHRHLGAGRCATATGSAKAPLEPVSPSYGTAGSTSPRAPCYHGRPTGRRHRERPSVCTSAKRAPGISGQFSFF